MPTRRPRPQGGAAPPGQEQIPAPILKWREEWLYELSRAVSPIFKGWPMMPYRLTCGWPCRNGLARKRRVVGECHALESSKGGLHEIFISPVLDEPLEVAGTVCHELAHVAAGIPAGHGKGFVKVCRHVGLTKNRPTSAMPGEILLGRLRRWVEPLGAYPHQAIAPAQRPAKPRTSVKLACTSCGCACTMGIKWIAEVGPPTCACGAPMKPAELD